MDDRTISRLWRRPTRYGLGFNIWFVALAAGLALVALGLSDRGLSMWESVLAILAGLGCLVWAWLVMTSKPPG